LDLIGLINKINDAGIAIDSGRKGFATRGKAEEGFGINGGKDLINARN